MGGKKREKEEGREGIRRHGSMSDTFWLEQHSAVFSFSGFSVGFCYQLEFIC